MPVYIPLLRVASSALQISVLAEYVRFSSGSLSGVLASFVLCFIPYFCFSFLVFFCSYFSGPARVVVFSYPVHWRFTCLTLEFAIIYTFLSSSVSQSVTTELVSSLGG